MIFDYTYGKRFLEYGIEGRESKGAWQRQYLLVLCSSPPMLHHVAPSLRPPALLTLPLKGPCSIPNRKGDISNFKFGVYMRDVHHYFIMWRNESTNSELRPSKLKSIGRSMRVAACQAHHRSHIANALLKYVVESSGASVCSNVFDRLCRDLCVEEEGGELILVCVEKEGGEIVLGRVIFI